MHEITLLLVAEAANNLKVALLRSLNRKLNLIARIVLIGTRLGGLQVSLRVLVHKLDLMTILDNLAGLRLKSSLILNLLFAELPVKLLQLRFEGVTIFFAPRLQLLLVLVVVSKEASLTRPRLVEVRRIIFSVLFILADVFGLRPKSLLKKL